MTTIYLYRVYCVTDSTYETIWAEDEPTTCPVNTAHTIDATKTAIIDSREPDQVTIKEETIATGGHFGCNTLVVNAIKNATTSVTLSWPHPISVLSLEFVTESVHVGDCISASISKDLSPMTSIPS